MLEYFDKGSFLSGDLYRLVDCYRPRLIYNPYTREKQFVGCRECPACLMKRSSRIANLLEREVKSSRYAVFFTLTYDNEHLNKWLVSVEDVEFTTDDGEVITRQKKVLRESSARHGDDPLLYLTETDDFVPPIRVWSNGKPHTIPNTFASVNVRDVQLFIKRLRRRIETLVNNYNAETNAQESPKIRYFIASEYGPKSFRPHYHGIIFTNSAYVAGLLIDRSRSRGTKDSNNVICKSWNMCNFDRIKPSIAKGEKAARYCAEYLCGSGSLPSILRHKPFRPFYICSRKPFIGFNSVDEEEVLGRFVSGIVASPQTSENGESTYLPFSLSVFTHFFPLPACSCSTTDQSKLLLYEKYRDKKFRVKGSKYNLISDCGNLLDLSPLGLHYSTDAYNYQDARFASAVAYWCNKPLRYKEFATNGLPTGRFLTIKLDPKTYISLLSRFHKRYEYFYMVQGYSRMEYLCSSGQLVDGKLKSLCNKYWLDPKNIVPYFWHRKQIALLPSVALSIDKLYNECPFLESLGESAIYIFYSVEDALFGSPGDYCFLSREYHLRVDLVDYIINENPLYVAQYNNTESLYHLKQVYKMHLDTFNSL